MNYPNLINELKNSKANPTIISIDGVAGSGKTTLAQRISNDLTEIHIIHMDDLYDGWIDPLSEELAIRIRSQILLPILKNGRAIYKKYDWALRQFDQEIEIFGIKYLILEGVGSGQQAFREFVNVAIWIEFDPVAGFERVINRDGEAIRNEMNKFLIDQEKHFSIEGTRNFAHYTLNGAP